MRNDAFCSVLVPLIFRSEVHTEPRSTVYFEGIFRMNFEYPVNHSNLSGLADRIGLPRHRIGVYYSNEYKTPVVQWVGSDGLINTHPLQANPWYSPTGDELMLLKVKVRLTTC